MTHRGPPLATSLSSPRERVSFNPCHIVGTHVPCCGRVFFSKNPFLIPLRLVICDMCSMDHDYVYTLACHHDTISSFNFGGFTNKNIAFTKAHHALTISKFFMGHRSTF